MPIVYRDLIRSEPRLGTDVPASRRDVLTEQFAMTYEENPIQAFKRYNALREDERTGPVLEATAARQKLKDAGLDRDLKVNDAGITQAALATLMDRKRTELKRQEIFSRAQGGAGEFTQRLALSIATTMADPISAGLNFVPVVGQVRYARWLAEAGSIGGRIAVRAGVGAAEGAVGAALQEPFIYGMRTQEQADYSSADSLLNIALGGIAGGGLHSFVGAAGDLIARRLDMAPTARVEPPARTEPTLGDATRITPRDEPPLEARDFTPLERTIDELPPQAREAALRAAVGQAVEGRMIDVENILTPQMRQTATPEFQSWFRDSKVIDEAGEPLRVYHGTQQDISEFNTPSWFTSDPGEASRYATGSRAERAGANVVPAYISIKNPYKATYSEIISASSELRAKLQAQGYDGMMMHQTPMLARDGKSFLPDQLERDWYVPFDSAQVKSAVGNSGRFDPKAASLTDPRAQADFKATMDHAEEVLAREPKPKGTVTESEARLQMAQDEADLAVADATASAKRLGSEFNEDDIAENLEKAERWARVAELATVCLTRGD